jgi:hypothetical protein
VLSYSSINSANLHKMLKLCSTKMHKKPKEFFISNSPCMSQWSSPFTIKRKWLS